MVYSTTRASSFIPVWGEKEIIKVKPLVAKHVLYMLFAPAIKTILYYEATTPKKFFIPNDR